ncbi:POL4-like protein [Mya arenaria]|uniref:POL4-like protein n=1 Tax=Mya arenaria TaxID=6604 RepID=A0ABY7GB18_MYAAR|nr:POL4-like protein [Mya arenaria]
MATSSPDPEISFDNVDLINDNDHTANSQENDNLIDMSSIQHERDHRSNSEALSSNVRSRTGPSMPASEIINAHSTPQHTDDRLTRSSVRNNTTLKPTMAQIPTWSSSDISCSQSNDTSLCYIIQAMEANSKPDWSSVSDMSAVVKTLWRMWDRLEIQNGILYRIWYDDSNISHRQIVVPDSHKADVFLYSHDIPSAAHLCVNKTLERLRQTFYWSGMKDDVPDYCNKCDLCLSRKPSKPTKSPLGVAGVSGPNERVAIDISGPLPKSSKGNCYVLVVCDCFTRWTEAIPIANQEAETVAKAFVDVYVSRFGVPLQVHSDLGTNFTSKDMFELLQIHHTKSTSQHPQSNGNVERFNRTLAVMLTMYCDKNQRNWNEFLPQVMLAYRSSTNASTGVTPNKMVFGREIILPLQASVRLPPDPDKQCGSYS